MNKKLLLILLVIIIVAFVAYRFWPSPKPTVAISEVYNVTEPGMTFLVNITVTDVSNLKTWAINLSWDPSIIKITTGDPYGLKPIGRNVRYNVYEGPFLKAVRETGTFQVREINNEHGRINRLSCGYEFKGETASGSGVLVTINFTCVSVGTTTIKITGSSDEYPGQSFLEDSTGNEIPHVDKDGKVTDSGS